MLRFSMVRERLEKCVENMLRDKEKKKIRMTDREIIGSV